MYFYFGKLCHRCINQMAVDDGLHTTVLRENWSYYLKYLLFRIPEFSLTTIHLITFNFLFGYKIT